MFRPEKRKEKKRKERRKKKKGEKLKLLPSIAGAEADGIEKDESKTLPVVKEAFLFYHSKDTERLTVKVLTTTPSSCYSVSIEKHLPGVRTLGCGSHLFSPTDYCHVRFCRRCHG